MSAVVVDVQAVQTPHHPERGIARYVAELALALGRHDGGRVAAFAYDPSLGQAAVFDRLRDLAPLVRLDDPLVASAAVYHVGSPFDADRPGRALLPAAARAPGVRRVATLYDVIPLVMADDYLPGPVARAHYRRGIELVRACDALVSISAASAVDAERLLGVPAARLHVIGAGAGEAFVPPAEPPAVILARLTQRLPDLRAGYVLAPSGMDPRKNWRGLLEAYARLPESQRSAHQLVLACRIDATQGAAVRSHAAALGVDDRLVLTDVVDDETLVRLYQAAHLVVFASRYEGYGLPALEARRCGTPVLCGDNSSLREVITDPAARFDADDPTAIAALVQRALADDRWRTALAAAALPDHTWDRAAARTAAVYDELLGSRPARPIPRRSLRPLRPQRPPEVAPRPLVRLAAAAEPVVSCCMVLYRGGALALDALAALAEHTTVPYEVIVIDNCSPDRSGALVRASTRGVRFVANTVNVGFGPAMNQAVRLARGEHVCFLNPDTVVHAGWLGPLLRRIARPGVGAVAPLFVDPDGSTVQEAGGVIDGAADAAHVGSVRWGDDGSATTARVADYASAACLLVRRAAFDAVGGFDPRYRLAYYEDADLAFALAAAGWRLWFEPAARVAHHKGGTDAGGAAALLAAENRPRFAAKWSTELAQRPRLTDDPATRLALRDWRVDHRVVIVADGMTDVAALARAWRAAAPNGAIALVGTTGIPSDRGLELVDVERHDARDPATWWAGRGDHDDIVVLAQDPLVAPWRETLAPINPGARVVSPAADPAAVLAGTPGTAPRFRWPV